MKIYHTPILLFTPTEDVITASSGDTPQVDVEW